MRWHPAELIAKKRDGGTWTRDEIADLVAGVVAGASGGGGLGDAQLGALLMAVCCRGLDVAETSTLTLAMRDSGRVLDFSAVPGAKIDKHSTGGVGDKVSLLLAPWVAAAGVVVPMVSGRGLGHTGGTIDKLDAIPGYDTQLSPDRMLDVLRGCGYAMAAPSDEIAPADRRMYAARDVSGTVESVPLITASILSKKLAAGIDGLVMDVKCGRAAFMHTRADAEALLDSLVRTGRAAGLRMVGLLTDMDAPLGRCLGNALEVREAVACLHGQGPEDLMAVTRALAAEMVVLGGRAPDLDAAGQLLDRLLADGSARQRLARNLELQGGDPGLVDDVALLPAAAVVTEVAAARGGYVVDVDPMALGLCVRDLGGGRRQPDDRIDPSVGLVLRVALGDVVTAGQALAEVHAADATAAAGAGQRVAAAITVADAPVAPRPRVLARVG